MPPRFKGTKKKRKLNISRILSKDPGAFGGNRSTTLGRCRLHNPKRSGSSGRGGGQLGRWGAKATIRRQQQKRYIVKEKEEGAQLGLQSCLRVGLKNQEDLPWVKTEDRKEHHLTGKFLKRATIESREEASSWSKSGRKVPPE